MPEKKNVYISLHEAFVREGIQYTDRATGEQRSFNVVRLPPLALGSLDEPRQMGVGYLKNFAAVCLAGVIILVLLVSFPIVLGGLNAASAGAPVVDSIVGGLSYALQYLAMCVLLILSLVKSGSWARDVLGG